MKKIEKLSKVFLIIYMVLTFLNVILPDEFVIGIEKLDYRLDPFQMIIRWFNFVGFVTLPVAVYFKKPIFKKIAIYFSLPVLVIFMFMFKDILSGYTSELGTGFVDIRYMPQFISSCMRNGIFRGIIFFVMCLSELATIILIIFNDPKALQFKKEEVGSFLILLPLLIVTIVPTYAIEGLLDHQSNIPFTFMSIPHIIWIVWVVLEIIGIYFIFKNKSEEDKYILVLILSLSLFMQYNMLFSSLGEVICERFPLQLCNVAAYLVLFSVLFKNREAFIVTLILNFVGGLIAIGVLDSYDNNILSKDNMHYILCHNNVIVIPIISLLLGVFEPLKKGEFKIFIKWFSVYFLFVFVLGTIFTSLKNSLESDYFYCNYLYMFDPSKGIELVPFSKPLFDVKILIGNVDVYILVDVLIYLFFLGVCYLVFLVFKSTIKDKKLSQNNLNEIA